MCSRFALQLETEVAETLKEHAELEQQCMELDKVRSNHLRQVRPLVIVMVRFVLGKA